MWSVLSTIWIFVGCSFKSLSLFLYVFSESLFFSVLSCLFFSSLFFLLVLPFFAPPWWGGRSHPAGGSPLHSVAARRPGAPTSRPSASRATCWEKKREIKMLYFVVPNTLPICFRCIFVLVTVLPFALSSYQSANTDAASATGGGALSLVMQSGVRIWCFWSMFDSLEWPRMRRMHWMEPLHKSPSFVVSSRKILSLVLQQKWHVCSDSSLTAAVEWRAKKEENTPGNSKSWFM